MKTSELLQKAWELISQVGAHSQRAPARNAFMEPVHALHESAVCWDPVGAVQKVAGAVDSPLVRDAIVCLQMGAMKVSPLKLGGRGVVEISDHGTRDELQALFVFSIQIAEQVEAKIAAMFSPRDRSAA